MEHLLQTLHTYIQPNSPRGRHKQRQHIAATCYNTVRTLVLLVWTTVIE